MEDSFKPCIRVPCPDFQEMAITVEYFCSCYDLESGQLYKPGCRIHDPDLVDAE